MINSLASSFTPWFKLIVKAFLFPLWQDLLDRKDAATGHVNALDLADHANDTIHRL